MTNLTSSISPAVDPYAKAKVKLISGSDGVAYVESGQGPTIVFVHGSLCDFRYWKPQLSELSNRYRTVAISLRHHFPVLPSSIGKPFSWREHVDQVAAFVAKLQEGKAHIVGHSRGACIAYHVVRQHPHLAASLTLVDPGGPNEIDAADGHELPVDVRDVRQQAVHLIEAGKIDDGLRLFVESTSRPGFWDRSAPVFQSMARDNAFTLGPQIADPLPVFRADESRDISCPTLIVQGERSPAMYRRNSDLLNEWILDTVPITLMGASHGMTWSHHQAFNRQLSEFLTTVASRHKPQ